MLISPQWMVRTSVTAGHAGPVGSDRSGTREPVNPLALGARDTVFDSRVPTHGPVAQQGARLVRFGAFGRRPAHASDFASIASRSRTA